MAYNCKPTMGWNPETGVATCTITIKGNTFCGVAKCCEEDRVLGVSKPCWKDFSV